MELPAINLDFLRSLTDGTGMIQHTKFAIPQRREGYTTDDNARGLIACVKYLKLRGDADVVDLMDIYLSFLLYMQRPDGRFHNVLGYNRRFRDRVGSEDCMGRSLWACGHVLTSDVPTEKKKLAKEIFDRGFPWIPRCSSPRSKAFAILGLAQYRDAYPQDENVVKNIKMLADQLVMNYRRESSDNWRWFEPYLTYANGRLSQALFETYLKTRDEQYLHVAKESFDFILSLQLINGIFVPIGNNGWYKKGGKRALFDQQPIEAGCMVETALTAFRSTNGEKYEEAAGTIFDWFLGSNSLRVMIYDPETGGCHDGITLNGLNLNQGAEAIVSYLMARLDLEMTK